jgi:hypothetical protein
MGAGALEYDPESGRGAGDEVRERFLVHGFHGGQMDISTFFLLASIVWFVMSVLLFTIRLLTRRPLLLSIKQVLGRVTLFFFIFLLLFSAADILLFALAFSESTNSVPIFAVVPSVLLFIIFLFALFSFWWQLRKYEFITFNVSTDLILDGIEKILGKYNINYIEENLTITCGNNPCTFEVQNLLAWNGIKVSNKGALPFWANFRTELQDVLKDKKSSNISMVVLFLLLFLPNFVFLPLNIIFPEANLYFWDRDAEIIYFWSNTLERLAFPFYPLIFLAIIFLLFGIRLLIRKPVVVTAGWMYVLLLPMMIDIILLSLSGILRFGITWIDFSSAMDLCILYFIARSFSKLVYVYNADQETIRGIFRSVLQQQGVDFAENRSRFILELQNNIAIELSHPGNMNVTIIGFETLEDRSASKTLLMDFSNKMKKISYKGSYITAITFIILGSILLLLFLSLIRGL